MTDQAKSYFRPAIDAMQGYVPGEQPKGVVYTKLNTNENPYPPSAKISKALANIDLLKLCRYPDPVCVDLRDAMAELFGLTRDWVIAGNGSDDILTIIFRSFSGGSLKVAAMDPSYSLYPVLADIQGAELKLIDLEADYSLPADLLKQASGCNVLILTRPNAPTGNCYPLSEVEQICEAFDGIVVVDEAYADFAKDHCVDLVKRFNNLIITRTLSKSYALAHIRLGFGIADPKLIDGMMKVKDSYNVNGLTQLVGGIALRDQEHLIESVRRIKATRGVVAEALTEQGFDVLPSEGNFLMAKPPCDAATMFERLRDAGMLIRYFRAPRIKAYLRISIGSEDEMKQFVKITEELVKELS